MDFSLSDEQLLFRESVESFVAKEYDADKRRALVAGEDGFSRAHWASFAALGWLGLGLDEAHGGLGGTALDTTVLMEGFGRALALHCQHEDIVVSPLDRIYMLHHRDGQYLRPIRVAVMEALALQCGVVLSSCDEGHIAAGFEKASTDRSPHGAGAIDHVPHTERVVVRARTVGKTSSTRRWMMSS